MSESVKEKVLKRKQALEEESQKKTCLVLFTASEIADHLNKNPKLLVKIKSMDGDELCLSDGEITIKDKERIAEIIADDKISKMSIQQCDKSEWFFNQLTEDEFKKMENIYVFVFTRNN